VWAGLDFGVPLDRQAWPFKEAQIPDRLPGGPHLLQVRLFKSAADALPGTDPERPRRHGRTWVAPLVMLWPLVVFWTPVVSIVVGAWESHPAVLLAGFAAYVALYATLWPSRSLFRFTR